MSCFFNQVRYQNEEFEFSHWERKPVAKYIFSDYEYIYTIRNATTHYIMTIIN